MRHIIQITIIQIIMIATACNGHVDNDQDMSSLASIIKNIVVSAHGPRPVLSSCGRSPMASETTLTVTSNGLELLGTFRTGSAATTCTVVFDRPFAEIPNCVLIAESSPDLSEYTISRTTIEAHGVEADTAYDYLCTEPIEIVNDYRIGSADGVVRFHADAPTIYTGLHVDEALDGRILTLYNVGPADVFLVNDDIRSLLGDRIRSVDGSPIWLSPQMMETIVYDHTRMQWLEMARSEVTAVQN
jgi:hypothetical protein